MVIVDFTVNLGAGRLQTRRFGGGSTCGIGWLKQELRLWVHGGGKVLPGLVARRHVESHLLIASKLDK